jgi:hypothetical protein
MTRQPSSLFLSVFAVACALLMAGCFTMRYEIPSEQPRASYDVIGSFEVQKRASWLILGLIPMREVEVAELVAEAVEREGGDAATNVVVTAQYDGTDVIVSLLVGGIYNTRSYLVTGDVVRLRAAATRPAGDLSPIIGAIRYESAVAP